MLGDFLNKKQTKLRLFSNCVKHIEQNNLVRVHSALMKLGSVVLALPYSVKHECQTSSYYTVPRPKKFIGAIVLLQFLYVVYTIYPVYQYGKTPILNGYETNTLKDGRISASIKSVVVYLVVAKDLISVTVIWNSRILISKIQTQLARVSALMSNLCGNLAINQAKSIIWTLGAIFMFRTFWEVFMVNMDNDRTGVPGFENVANQVVMHFHGWYSRNFTVPDHFTALEFMGGVSVCLASVYAFMFANFVDLWSYTAVILLNFIMTRFTSNLKNGNIRYDQEEQVVELLDHICRFVELINDKIHWIFAANVMITMPYQTAYLMDAFHTDIGPLCLANLFVDFVYYVGILVIAADANSKSKEISCWFQYRTFDSKLVSKDQPMRERTSIILSRIDADAIAFRGGPFFTLTYSFLGNAVSFIITYSVIIMQSQTPN